MSDVVVREIKKVKPIELNFEYMFTSELIQIIAEDAAFRENDQYVVPPHGASKVRAAIDELNKRIPIKDEY